MDKTEWYPVSVKPVRAGVYECSYDGTSATKVNPVLRVWTGQDWTIHGLHPSVCEFGSRKRDCWRGLTRAAYLKAGGK